MAKALLLTGSTGFVGSRFKDLNGDKYQIRTIPWKKLGDPDVDLKGIEVVVHMAALNHRMDAVPDQEYFKSNFELSKTLGERAKADGVGHFIFLSTVKVYGQTNIDGRPFTENDSCNPVDAYGESKLKAEEALKLMESETFNVSIIRCPLVYGPNVKGNMERLIKLSNSSYPLGFKGIDNKRTMVFVDNLIALIDQVIEQRRAGTFLAGDDQPVSISDAVTMLRQALGREPNMFKVPGILMGMLGWMAPSLKTRLFDSLVFDNDQTKKQLNFHNPYTTQEGFEVMVGENPNKPS